MCVVLICLWLKEKIWNNIIHKIPRRPHPPETTRNKNGRDKEGGDQEDGGPVNRNPCKKKPCRIIAKHRHHNVRSRGKAVKSSMMLTKMNVDKAYTSRRPRPDHACTYNALANPHGQEKGNGKEKGTRVLENKFLHKYEKVQQNLKIREREREKDRERKKNEKYFLEGARREKRGKRTPAPQKSAKPNLETAKTKLSMKMET